MRGVSWVLRAAAFAAVGCAHPVSEPRPSPPRPVWLSSARLAAMRGASEANPAAFLAEAHPPETAPLQDWPVLYREAAHELRAWAREYPDAADRLTEWDEDHPDRLHVLVLWAMTHPYDDLGAFFLTRTDWDELAAIETDYTQALSDFIGWCRRSPPAAVELVRHHEGLAWLMRSGLTNEGPLSPLR